MAKTKGTGKVTAARAAMAKGHAKMIPTPKSEMLRGYAAQKDVKPR